MKSRNTTMTKVGRLGTSNSMTHSAKIGRPRRSGIWSGTCAMLLPMVVSIFLGGADSRYLREVEIQVGDAPTDESPLNWRAQISAEGLYEFCRRLARHIDENFG